MKMNKQDALNLAWVTALVGGYFAATMGVSYSLMRAAKGPVLVAGAVSLLAPVVTLLVVGAALDDPRYNDEYSYGDHRS